MGRNHGLDYKYEGKNFPASIVRKKNGSMYLLLRKRFLLTRKRKTLQTATTAILYEKVTCQGTCAYNCA